jgi:cytochrome d ubiquinol oxidase subunit II
VTLTWMVGFVVIFMPIIVWYTSWAFWVMRGKVSVKHVETSDHAY